MGQRLARREIEDGLQLYHQQNHEAAIRKWKRALHRISGRRDRFVALGYLAAAHGDCGKYRDMLAYAVQQIDTANETESAAMRAEAYWNLARSNERLCEYHKAVSYARHSLQNEPRDIRLHGYVYLCQANAYFGFSNFVSALENLGRAMSIAKQCGDTPLELHVFSSLGHIFTCLKDYEKGLNFHLKAVALAKSFDVCDISWKYDRMTSLNVVTPYRKLGRYEEAMECCEDAMKLALEDGDRPTQGKCLCCFADIHRNGNDMQRAIPRYEAAVSIMVEIGDRYGQIEALVGMAKSMLAAKQINKALDYNAKALDLATNIGNKMHMLRCRILLTDIYRLLGDTRMVAEEQCRCRRLQEDMQLICRACTKCLGESPNHLEFLPCCHLVHNRCAYEATRRGSSKNNRSSKFISCPTCSKDVPKDSVYL